MLFQHTNKLGKYLGVQLHHERVSRSTTRSVIEKMKRRLRSWKVRMLSFSGRLTLN